MYTAALFFARQFAGSFELRRGVAESLEGSVGHLGTMVVHEGHHRLVHGTIPLDVAWLSESVPVGVLVVLMVDWVLASLPLTVSIRNGRVSWQDTSQVPVEQVRVVSQGLHVDGVVVHHDWTVVGETTGESTNDKPANVEVSDPASDVEVLDGEFTDDSETESNSQLSAGGVVSVIEVGLESGACDFIHLSLREPALENIKVFLGLGGESGQLLDEFLLGKTETDKVTILDILGGLGIDLSSLEIIISILNTNNSSCD